MVMSASSAAPSSSGGAGRPGPARRRPGEFGGSRKFTPRRKVCQFCVDKIKEVDYKDLVRLRRFLSERGKIEPRRKTGTCAAHQRSLTVALKRARQLALLPFTAEHIRVTGVLVREPGHHGFGRSWLPRLGNDIGIKDDHFPLRRRMAADIGKVYPQLAEAPIEYTWSGTMGYAIHKMPQIGMVQPGVWIASAFGGHGLNTTAIAGELVAAAMVEQDDRWRLFIPFGLVWAALLLFTADGATRHRRQLALATEASAA